MAATTATTTATASSVLEKVTRDEITEALADKSVQEYVGKHRWQRSVCLWWVGLLLVLYALPTVFDFRPDLDTYVNGSGPLGIWGTIILTLLGAGLSIGYGAVCVNEKTVYRCVGGGCGKDSPPLMYPDQFPTKLKVLYAKELVGVDKSAMTMHPFSEFNRKLSALNDELLYTK